MNNGKEKGSIGARVSQLEREMKRLRRRSASFVVPVSELGSEPYELEREVSIVVQPQENCFVATYFDANINASGDTPQDALANLKDVMILLFERLSREPAENLGKGPSHQLSVLRGLIRRKRAHAAH